MNAPLPRALCRTRAHYPLVDTTICNGISAVRQRASRGRGREAETVRYASRLLTAGAIHAQQHAKAGEAAAIERRGRVGTAGVYVYRNGLRSVKPQTNAD